MNYVSFEDLLGDHELDAVDYGFDRAEEYHHTMYFRLDGITYKAKEDANDGYRSCMESLEIIEGYTFQNTFPPCLVAVECEEDFKRTYVWENTTAKILDFIDKTTKKAVLRVGTDHSDDEYPCFIAVFFPDHMLINSLVPELKIAK